MLLFVRMLLVFVALLSALPNLTSAQPGHERDTQSIQVAPQAVVPCGRTEEPGHERPTQHAAYALPPLRLSASYVRAHIAVRPPPRARLRERRNRSCLHPRRRRIPRLRDDAYP